MYVCVCTSKLWLWISLCSQIHKFIWCENCYDFSNQNEYTKKKNNSIEMSFRRFSTTKLTLTNLFIVNWFIFRGIFSTWRLHGLWWQAVRVGTFLYLNRTREMKKKNYMPEHQNAIRQASQSNTLHLLRPKTYRNYYYLST